MIHDYNHDYQTFSIEKVGDSFSYSKHGRLLI